MTTYVEGRATTYVKGLYGDAEERSHIAKVTSREGVLIASRGPQVPAGRELGKGPPGAEAGYKYRAGIAAAADVDRPREGILK